MITLLLILLLILLIIISLLISNKHIQKKKNRTLTLDPLKEIEHLISRLEQYKEQCIDGCEISDENATPLDNIAYFMTSKYPELDDTDKIKCSKYIFIYIDVINEMLDQVFKNPQVDDPKENDDWFYAHSKHLSKAYLYILTAVYPDIIEEHQDEFDKLSPYKYQEMQKAIEVWELENEYKTNDHVAKNR